jgi:hypothetical protein
MNICIEFLSKSRTLLGLSYRIVEFENSKKEKIKYKEIGIGFVFINFFILFR